MTKAYWIAHLDVGSSIAYENYRAANAETFAKFNGVFIIRGAENQLRRASQKAVHL